MRRRKTAIFFLIFGICLSGLALALNVGWIWLSVSEVAILVLGIIFFALIITGLILNTIFLVREIRNNERHDAFLNAVTHELKTPIASIKLYLETLRSRDVSEEKRQEFYEIMKADSDRLLGTVEQVLQASRLKEARREYNVTELDLNELISAAAAQVRTQYKLDAESIRYYETLNEVKVLGDRTELLTAFTNLLDNAVKYSGTEPQITVRTRHSAISRQIIIVFRDRGVGLQEADLKRIFKRFYRASSQKVKEVRGTGLGLFIVKSIIEKHGGKIRAESKGEGKGSTFFVQLPEAQ